MWWRRKPEPLWKRGENLAVKHLKRAGYRILERNVRLGRYEIDIIARDKDTICFVEVRTRLENDPVPPEDSLTRAKRLHLRHAAQQYIARHRNPAAYYRFDVVAVILPEKGKPQITLYKDAFQPGPPITS